jgi:hypothetical protein
MLYAGKNVMSFNISGFVVMLHGKAIFQRMVEGRLPKIALKWMPKQRRARGRPKKNWMEGRKKAINGRNLKEGQLEDREQWSLGVGQRRKTFQNRR